MLNKYLKNIFRYFKLRKGNISYFTLKGTTGSLLVVYVVLDTGANANS